MQHIKDIISLIESALINIEEEEENKYSGAIIHSGYDSEVDELRETIFDSKEWLGNYQAQLSSETGINNLKIKFTNAGGYFIEVSKNNITKIPNDFIHKQTLVNAGRFMTQKLQDFSDKLLYGESQLREKEGILFQELCEKIVTEYGEIKKISEQGAFLDFVNSLTIIGYNGNYCKVNINKKSILDIKGGRHAVIESIEKDFISNNLTQKNQDFIHIVTGPNMGGKSTFLRQNALIILLAHIGSYVPARSADIPLTDKIFSRVGASDNLYLGQSTFMVEMQEVSYILHNSTKNSFVIIDEIGRGTSTFDGMSLAWAILVYIHKEIQAKTLFATHYHELIDHSKNLKGVRNFSVAVGENEDNIIFLRKIIAGGIKKSYGIAVAKLAGIPEEIINVAQNMLHTLESNTVQPQQLSFDTPICVQKQKPSELELTLDSIDTNNITPLEALILLQKMKNIKKQ